MSRKPRFVLPGIPQHIIQRGNNREPCFYSEQDYSRYLEDLTQAAEKNRVAIHSYVLMTNHVHILATPDNEFGVSHMMQDLGRKFVRYMNHTYQRTGTLWEGRFKASLVDSEAYLLTCMKYIELNPVRANMVVHPGAYRWSSYGHNAAGKTNGLIQSHPSYLGLGTKLVERTHAYRELFRMDIDKEQVHEIREALNHELVLGRDDFKDKIEQMTIRQVRPKLLGRHRVEELGVEYIIP